MTPTELSVLCLALRCLAVSLTQPHLHGGVKWGVGQVTQLFRRRDHGLHVHIDGSIERWLQESYFPPSFLRSSSLKLFETIWGWEGFKSFQLGVSELKTD